MLFTKAYLPAEGWSVRLKDLRERLRLTKALIAARLEVGESSYTKWEGGKVVVPKHVRERAEELEKVNS